MALARIQYQNSLRLARPSNRAYFAKKRLNASRNPMPYQGAHSGGTPSGPTGTCCCGW